MDIPADLLTQAHAQDPLRDKTVVAASLFASAYIGNCRVGPRAEDAARTSWLRDTLIYQPDTMPCPTE